jgi:hypothetical protein
MSRLDPFLCGIGIAIGRACGGVEMTRRRASLALGL